MISKNEKTRLNKLLALRLGVSRREADELIEQKRITVNGGPARLGQTITSKDVICFDSKKIESEDRFLYLAMNKPVGYVSSKSGQGAPTVYELLPEEYKSLKTVGRLDKNSSGLILLTNDGDFAFRMTHPKFKKIKIYEVILDRELEPLHQQMIGDFGVDLPDGRSQLGLEKLDESRRTWRVTMSEGRNRQIRRTFGALGYTVVGLHRVQFGAYKIDGLEDGSIELIKKI